MKEKPKKDTFPLVEATDGVIIEKTNELDKAIDKYKDHLNFQSRWYNVCVYYDNNSDSKEEESVFIHNYENSTPSLNLLWKIIKERKRKTNTILRNFEKEKSKSILQVETLYRTVQ